MLRFVLLRHECPAGYEKPSHWDFMLQQGEMLQTWELQQLPAEWAQALDVTEDGPACDSVLATQLADHRLAYLDHEGPIPGNRGAVHRSDCGTYEVLQQNDNLLQISLSGNALHSITHLRRDAAKPRIWQLTTIINHR